MPDRIDGEAGAEVTLDRGLERAPCEAFDVSPCDRLTPFSRHASLGYQVNLLARLLEQALRRRIATHGVVPGQFPALLALYERDGRTQAELSRLVRIEQPTMANTLNRMERDGLIAREPDPADGRRSPVRLTARGRELESALVAAAEAVNAEATRGLTEAEVHTLMTLLARVIGNLDPAASG